MATHTNSGTHPSREAMNFTLLPDSIINFTKRGTSLDHGNLVFYVDGDCAKVEHVEDDEGFIGDVGDTLVIMSSASDFELNVDGFGAYYSALDVRFCEGSDDE